MGYAKRFVVRGTPLYRMQHRSYCLDATPWGCIEDRLHRVVLEHSAHWLVCVVALLS